MDHQTQMKTYGKRDLPDGTDERPLVTFALFAYNQEQYIHEAVEGAFSQTYEPLEIILSDDCSSDRTFEIMQEMAATYKGRHRVTVRRSLYNLGTALHVQDVFSASSGRLFVVAAGDDISLPERTCCLYDAWKEAGFGTGVIHSGRYTFSDEEPRMRKQVEPACNVIGAADCRWIISGKFRPPAAPTCAYTRDIFQSFKPLMGGSVIEDAPLFFRVALVGKFMPSSEALVLQRKHLGSSGTGFDLASIERWNRFIRSRFVSILNMRQDLLSVASHIEAKEMADLEKLLFRRAKNVARLFLPACGRVSALSLTKFIILSLTTNGAAINHRDRLAFCYNFLLLHRFMLAKIVAQRLKKKRQVHQKTRSS